MQSNILVIAIIHSKIYICKHHYIHYYQDKKKRLPQCAFVELLTDRVKLIYVDKYKVI